MKFEYYEELHNYITTHHNNHKPQLVSDTETRGNEDNYYRRKDGKQLYSFVPSMTRES